MDFWWRENRWVVVAEVKIGRKIANGSKLTKKMFIKTEIDLKKCGESEKNG